MADLNKIKEAFAGMEGKIDTQEEETTESIKAKIVKAFEDVVNQNRFGASTCYSQGRIVETFESMILTIYEKEHAIVIDSRSVSTSLEEMVEQLYLTGHDSIGHCSILQEYTLLKLVTDKTYSEEDEEEDFVVFDKRNHESPSFELPPGFMEASLNLDADENYSVSSDAVRSKLLAEHPDLWPEWSQTVLEVYARQDLDIKRALCLYYIEGYSIQLTTMLLGYASAHDINEMVNRFVKDVYCEYNPQIQLDRPVSCILTGLSEDVQVKCMDYLRDEKIETLEDLIEFVIFLDFILEPLYVPRPLLECFKEFNRSC